MAGEQDLAVLLATMEPALQEEEYVFCTIPLNQNLPPHIDPLGMFREIEGRTLIVETGQAEGLDCPKSAEMRLISLTVHSSFEAVGLTAAVSNVLANHDISANVVAGYYHDHIFVPSVDAGRAIQALRDLSASLRKN